MPSILIVEDHGVIGAMIARFLREMGKMDVPALVGTGEEALARLPGLAVDLVLADVALPGMSGIELAAALHARYPDLPCLMLSGHKESGYVQHALAAGARGYVAKGDPEDILEGVRCVLDGEVYLSQDLRP